MHVTSIQRKNTAFLGYYGSTRELSPEQKLTRARTLCVAELIAHRVRVNFSKVVLWIAYQTCLMCKKKLQGA